MKTLERLVAERLLKIKAVKLQPANPFTWASGWKSPIYNDNRKTLSYPEIRSFIKLELARTISEKYENADAIAGVATGAIAQGALVADLLGLPFVYIRSTPKDHGLENLIEGELKPGSKVVIVEDLVSTGGSSLKLLFQEKYLLKLFGSRCFSSMNWRPVSSLISFCLKFDVSHATILLQYILPAHKLSRNGGLFRPDFSGVNQ